MIDFLDLFCRPHRWSNYYRKIFVLTIPVSGPLYLLVMILTAILLAIICLLAFPTLWLISVWQGKEMEDL